MCVLLCHITVRFIDGLRRAFPKYFAANLNRTLACASARVRVAIHARDVYLSGGFLWKFLGIHILIFLAGSGGSSCRR